MSSSDSPTPASSPVTPTTPPVAVQPKKEARHRLRCLNCMVIIESLYGHHFVTCKCGDCSVDGGPGWGGRTLSKDFNKIELLPTDDPEDNRIATEKMRQNVKEGIERYRIQYGDPKKPSVDMTIDKETN